MDENFLAFNSGPASLHLVLVSSELECELRQAVLRLAGGTAGKLAEPGVVRVVDVPDAGKPPGFERFVSAAVAGSGQSMREIEETQRWRRDQVERVAGNITEQAGVKAPEAPDRQPGMARKPFRSAGNGGQSGKTQAGKVQPRKERAATSRSPASTMTVLANIAVGTVAVGTVGEDGSLA